MAGSAVLILVILLLVVGVGAAFLLLSGGSTKDNKYPLEGTWFNPGHEKSQSGGIKGMVAPHYIKYSRTNSNGAIVYKLTIPDVTGWNRGVPMIITSDPDDPERLTVTNIDGSDSVKWNARYIPDTDTIDYDTASGTQDNVWIRKKAYMEKFNV